MLELKLDQSIVLLASGKPKEAEKNLREIRDHFDHLEQKAVGFLATVVAGEVTIERGELTGATPGRLLRRRSS